ncbi:MAG: hypothetical protein CMN29_00820 [Sandaracinus sp.]|nr:hypothetical protein [Sandaracinus sp.]
MTDGGRSVPVIEPTATKPHRPEPLRPEPLRPEPHRPEPHRPEPLGNEPPASELSPAHAPRRRRASANPPHRLADLPRPPRLSPSATIS